VAQAASEHAEKLSNPERKAIGKIEIKPQIEQADGKKSKALQSQASRKKSSESQRQSELQGQVSEP